MASQGQRFRRKALRRGYKVDEVDAFLDRVEATLAGQPVGAPVASQEVHDVVFRVRFNGYDEWQVDLHLDRVERQLAELEERGGAPGGRGGDPRMADRLGPPMRDDRGLSPVPQPPMPPRPMPAQAGPPADRYGNRYDEPTGAFAGG
ncbi:DivIVA domain-containing protein, partial [Micromonospora sp. AMSO31t]|uniref:DivIVA domain-containing protein n=2 Tax=unclassified Micromonospora TaxID=2617518 RepID=UPI00124B4E3B